MAEKTLLRVLIDTHELMKIEDKSLDDFNAKPSEVTRVLLRLWMAGKIEITADDMVRMKGRDASTA